MLRIWALYFHLVFIWDEAGAVSTQNLWQALGKVMTLKLAHTSRGQALEIIGFLGSSMMQERLLEMGLRKGLKLEFLGQAPFGGPILIRFKTSVLALRTEEAECVEVQPS